MNKYFIIFLLIFTPFLIFAAPSDIGELAILFIGVLNKIIPLIIGASVVWFIYGVSKYISSKNEKR
jgi:hypothetical protein